MKFLVPMVVLAASCADPVGQSPVCARFVTCIEALDEVRGITTNVERYNPDGECWGSDVGAALCDTSCERGLAVIHQRFQAAPASCAP